MKVYAIRKWEVFEAEPSRRPAKAMQWWAHPTQLASRGRIRLLRMGDKGAWAYVVFNGIVSLLGQRSIEDRIDGRMVSSSGEPMDVFDISVAIHIDEKTVEESISILASKDIGWLVEVDIPDEKPPGKDLTREVKYENRRNVSGIAEACQESPEIATTDRQTDRQDTHAREGVCVTSASQSREQPDTAQTVLEDWSAASEAATGRPWHSGNANADTRHAWAILKAAPHHGERRAAMDAAWSDRAFAAEPILGYFVNHLDKWMRKGATLLRRQEAEQRAKAAAEQERAPPVESPEDVAERQRKIDEGLRKLGLRDAR